MTEKRKGARSTKDIPVPILQQLNEGKIETANLVEWLAVDQRVLLANILTQNNRTHYLQSVLDEVDQLKKQTVNTINEAIGSRLFLLTSEHKDTSFTTSLMQHSSDVVRCWATYFIGKNQQLSIEEKLEAIKAPITPPVAPPIIAPYIINELFFSSRETPPIVKYNLLSEE